MADTELLNGRLIVTTGDITTMSTGAIVNAANSSLMGGGGVDGAIHRSGGAAIIEECKRIRQSRYPDGLPTGEAVMTTAGNMPARHVIHTVGPVWHGGGSGEAEQLSSCYRRSLEVAAELSLKDIAFPAISTGIYGYPKDKAALVAFAAVQDFLESSELPQTVYFVFYSPGDARVFLDTIG
ncbi:MAG: O-acetyl-ADP-ribose deacetylase [Spirochaetaceae bacterium]|nr:MAG: O-acetyl-ADP-ribose deacetylase [Spirochaetaceae bacterium]